MGHTLSLIWAAATLVSAASAPAQTVEIPILNHSFDMDVLNCSPGSSCWQFGITGWTIGPQTNVQIMTTTQYPMIAPSTGLYVAAIGNSSAPGSIFQKLGATLQANTTYTLTLEVGARLDYDFTGYNAFLLAGNVSLASGHEATPLGGTFVTDLVVYKSGATPAQLGQPLQILITSKGNGQADIQDVVLTATPTAP
jgi:hypothetical protein